TKRRSGTHATNAVTIAQIQILVRLVWSFSIDSLFHQHGAMLLRVEAGRPAGVAVVAGAVEICVGEIRPPEVGAGQVYGPVRGPFAQIGALHLGAAQVGAVQVGRIEPCGSQVRR